jgi:hypothetical protein
MKRVRTNREARCPACLKTLNGATDPLGGATPCAGDLSVCCYCSVMLQFNTDLTLRLLRADEFEALPADVPQQLAEFRGMVQEWIAKA